MTSFYARTPSGFMVEYGWGGRDIAPDAWQPVELRDGPSLWGHERAWLPPEGARGRWPCAWTPRRGRARPGPGVARQSPRHGRRLSLVGCAAPLSRLAAPDGREYPPGAGSALDRRHARGGTDAANVDAAVARDDAARADAGGGPGRQVQVSPT